MKKLLLSLSLLLVCVAGNAQKNPVLTIEGGQVQGVLADDHPEVFVYRGIPYAAPPIRENRWKAPQPVVPWKGVKICDTFGRPSYQAIQYTGGYYTEWGYGIATPLLDAAAFVAFAGSRQSGLGVKFVFHLFDY